MDPQDAIDLGREAMKACFMVGGPILLASLLIGLLIGTLQAMTQVQDQSVSFVPKILGLALAIGIGLPWLTDKLIDFSRETLTTPMTHFHVSQSLHQASFVRTAQLPAFHAARSPVPDSDKMVPPTVAPETDKTSPVTLPSKIPFQLPHYRYLRNSNEK